MTHVCLIAEGSYPYVTGGVGKWTHDLIASLPEIEFTVVALWPTPGSPGQPKYPRLPNVREVRNLYLLAKTFEDGPVGKATYRGVEDFHHAVKQGDPGPFEKMLPGLHCARFMKDREAWELLCKLYRVYAPPGTSFPDYFWTWRATHLPLFNAIEAEVPRADVLHTISTGYAGFLAAVQRVKQKVPLVTTEHGLYTRERAMEIWDAGWIPGEAQAQERRTSNLFKDWWNRMFRSMELLTYAHSDCVITLFEENRRYQVAHGAPEARTRVIPNGVDLAVFDAVRRKRGPSGRFHVGLVGRVVPIKDIKTFISACTIVLQELGPQNVEVSVIGPSDEDEAYAAQCREMVSLLGYGDSIKFTGKVDSRKYYESLDVVVLTSLSEGQPLTILEALACEIPMVATDVGACREILEGREGDDRALGPAGIVTRLTDPADTARAILRLGRDPELRRAMGRAGRRRVERSYRLDQVRSAYLDLYRSMANGRR